MPFRKTHILIILLAGVIKLQGQDYIGIVFHQSDILGNRQAYSLGVVGEYHLGKSKQWYLDYQHDLGVTNQGLVFLHTTAPFALYTSVYYNHRGYSGHYHHGWLASTAAIMPSGVSFYYTQTRHVRYGFYVNPLNYSLWQTENRTSISALNPEAGFKMLKRLKHHTWLMASVGVGYSFSVGEDRLLPSHYANSAFVGLRIAVVNCSPLTGSVRKKKRR